MADADELRRTREREQVLAERADEAAAARMAAGMPAEPEAAPPFQRPSGAGALSIAVAVWLVVSPFVLDYRDDDTTWAPITAGATIGVLAVAARRAHWLSWLLVPLGAWLILCGFWLAESEQAKLNAWIAGVIVLVLGRRRP